jgi:hypothetical protein
MNASKENAAKALEALHKHGKVTGCLVANSKTLGLVREFLLAAERKLPREESFARAKKGATT